MSFKWSIPLIFSIKFHFTNKTRFRLFQRRRWLLASNQVSRPLVRLPSDFRIEDPIRNFHLRESCKPYQRTKNFSLKFRLVRANLFLKERIKDISLRKACKSLKTFQSLWETDSEPRPLWEYAGSYEPYAYGISYGGSYYELHSMSFIL